MNKKIFVVKVDPQYTSSCLDESILFIGSLNKAGKFINKMSELWKSGNVRVDQKTAKDEAIHNKKVSLYCFDKNQPLVNLDVNDFPSYAENLIETFYFHVNSNEKRLGLLED